MTKHDEEYAKRGSMHDNNDTDDDEPDGYHYARGVFRSLAEEEYHQPRVPQLSDYWYRPTGEEVVEVMVERGWSEDAARDAVRRLWQNQRRVMDYKAVDG